jgi:hypothetical protein
MEKATRICIKCGRELPLGMFQDNVRHKVNRCNDCRNVYMKEYRQRSDRRKTQNRLYVAQKTVKELQEVLNGEKGRN